MNLENFQKEMGDVVYLNKIIETYKDIPITKSIEKSITVEISKAIRKRLRKNLGNEYDNLSDEQIEDVIASIVKPTIGLLSFENL